MYTQHVLNFILFFSVCLLCVCVKPCCSTYQTPKFKSPLDLWEQKSYSVNLQTLVSTSLSDLLWPKLGIQKPTCWCSRLFSLAAQTSPHLSLFHLLHLLSSSLSLKETQRSRESQSPARSHNSFPGVTSTPFLGKEKQKEEGRFYLLRTLESHVLLVLRRFSRLG